MNKHNRTAALSIRWGLFAFALLLVAGFAFTYFQQQRSIDAAMDKIRSKYGSGSIRRACLLGEPTAENIAFCSLPD